MNKPQPSIIFCLLMDLIGFATSSYTFPILGDLADVIWAPVSGLIFFLSFRGWRGAVGGMFDMVEELLPGTDFIPSFTIMWLFRNWQRNKASIPIKVTR